MQRVILGVGFVVLAAAGLLLAQGGGERGRRPEGEFGGPPPRNEGHRPGPPPGGPRDHGPPPHGGFGGPHGSPGMHPLGMPPGPPPPQPLEMVLDTDDDGLISAKELENATAALKKLDRNNDGQLTEREYRGPRPHGHPGHPGPNGPPPRRPDGPPPKTSDASEPTPDPQVSAN